MEAVGQTGTFVVVFDGYGTQEEVGKDAIQLRMAEDDAGYKGGLAVLFCCLYSWVKGPMARKIDLPQAGPQGCSLTISIEHRA